MLNILAKHILLYGKGILLGKSHITPLIFAVLQLQFLSFSNIVGVLHLFIQIKHYACSAEHLSDMN